MATNGFFTDVDVQRRSTVDQVADAIRKKILLGAIPPGTPLREVSLAATLKVSRNTLRESIRLLLGEGLLRYTVNKGVTLSWLTAADVRDIYEARKAIETDALRRPVADPIALARAEAALAAYQRALRMRDTGTIAERDLEFHHALVGLLGSRRLTAFHRSLLGELRLALHLFDRQHDHANRWQGEHIAFWSAYVAGRRAEAANGLARHLDEAAHRLITSLEQPRSNGKAPSGRSRTRDRKRRARGSVGVLAIS